jgi:peptidoglycan/xylan/chitin deacetylase (PgdA/CDA1 family)
MLRTNPFRLYGVQALFAGTLLPARPVGAGAPGLLRDIAAAGHEVAPHGWDHFGWQDRVDRFDASTLRSELTAAARAYEAALGTPPAASAAPGWRMTEAALLVQEELGLAYATDVRGRAPFRPRVDGGPLKTIQLPTTMPTMDELLGRVPDVEGALTAALGDGLNVFTLHAEVEGGPLIERFAAWLGQLRRTGRPCLRLRELAEAARAERVPEHAVVRGHVAGRSGWVAVAGAA